MYRVIRSRASNFSTKPSALASKGGRHWALLWQASSSHARLSSWARRCAPGCARKRTCHRGCVRLGYASSTTSGRRCRRGLRPHSHSLGTLLVLHERVRMMSICDLPPLASRCLAARNVRNVDATARSPAEGHADHSPCASRASTCYLCTSSIQSLCLFLPPNTALLAPFWHMRWQVCRAMQWQD